MAANLPDYVASAKPVPADKRMPWFKSTAQTYAGIMLWFVFWASVPTNGPSDAKGDLLAGGILYQGLGVAVLGVVVAAFLCHFASYLAPGLMGMKTGLPLAVVGTSTYGVQGGFLMPGFLMGVLQFGWLAVNAYFSAELLAPLAGAAKDSSVHLAIGAVWAIVAAFVGLKGIQYVAKVATFLPLIPFVILLILAGKTLSGVGGFKPEMVMTDAVSTVPSAWSIFLFTVANIVGFFATAGAAGADIDSSNRNSNDVQWGGLVGVAGATIFTGVLALLIVAGTYGAGLMQGKDVMVNPTKLMETIMGDNVAKVFWLLLAVAAFPPACFSSLIAANSMKNTLPKVNPFVSVGIGTACSVALVMSGQAGKAAEMFGIIGASFGPICGAMTADFLLAGCKWPGPRAGFNLAGWISWAVGFVLGAIDMVAAKVPALSGIALHVPCPPVAAIVVGFVLYVILAKAGLQSRTLEMPGAQQS
jgi:cytosine permease